ncbi:MAG: tol-pal system protein YbgF [Thermoanaerobaculia bacterium]|nr:tol-pal system protein YbgF [Thermoanaerobaculia bacterium]
MTSPRVDRLRRSAPLAGALLFASVLGGCVSGSDIEGLHRHVTDVEKQVDKLSQQTSSKDEVEKLNQNLTKQVATILRSNAETGTRFDELTRELQALAGKLEDSNRRLAQLSQQLAETQAKLDAATPSATAPVPGTLVIPGGPAAVPAVPAPAPGTTKPPAGRAGPADLYNAALGDYQRGRFELARQGFEEYVETYPRTDLSDDALFWAAECWTAQKKHREALGTLERLLKEYPQSDKASSAHLRKGLAHLELGEKAQAIVQLQFVVHEYPTSDEAKSARQRLRSLGSDSR